MPVCMPYTSQIYERAGYMCPNGPTGCKVCNLSLASPSKKDVACEDAQFRFSSVLPEVCWAGVGL